jgi:hypothetical protein
LAEHQVVEDGDKEYEWRKRDQQRRDIEEAGGADEGEHEEETGKYVEE